MTSFKAIAFMLLAKPQCFCIYQRVLTRLGISCTSTTRTELDSCNLFSSQFIVLRESGNLGDLNQRNIALLRANSLGTSCLTPIFVHQFSHFRSLAPLTRSRRVFCATRIRKVRTLAVLILYLTFLFQSVFILLDFPVSHPLDEKFHIPCTYQYESGAVGHGVYSWHLCGC